MSIEYVSRKVGLGSNIEDVGKEGFWSRAGVALAQAEQDRESVAHVGEQENMSLGKKSPISTPVEMKMSESEGRLQ